MKASYLALLVFLSLTFAPVPSAADPPPWAPAHGWRRAHDPSYVGYTGKKWDRDYGILEGRCNSAAVGTVLGGAVGGVIGSHIGDDSNRPIATLVGAAIGAFIGHDIGTKLDESDRACMGHALELAGENKTVRWTNHDTGATYQLVPTRDFREGNQACREFTTFVSTGRKKDTFTNVACRGGNGEWLIRR